MSKAVRGRNATIYVGGINASAYLNEYEMESERDDLDVTPFESDDKDYLSGPSENSTTLTGFWNGDEDSLDEILDDTFGSDDANQICVFPGGVLSGKAAYILADATQLKYKVDAKSDDITEAEAEFRSKRYRGIVLKTPAAVTTSGTTTAVVQADATSFGAVAAIHILSVTGTPDSIAFSVESSADGTSWVPLILFGTLTDFTEPQAIHIETDKTVTVHEQLRVKWTITGGTSPVVKFAVIFHRRKHA